MEYYESNRGSHFMDVSEVTEQFVKQDFNRLYEKQPGGGPPIISDGKNHIGLSNDTNTLCCSTIGSGKSVSIIMPTILSFGLSRYSMAVLDVKGELKKNTSGILKELGYKIYVLDFRNPNKSMRYNLFASAYEDYHHGKKASAQIKLKRIFQILTRRVESSKDKFWENVSEDTMIGLMELLLRHAKCTEQCNFWNLYELLLSAFEKCEGTTQKRIEKYLKLTKEDAEAKSIARNLFSASTAPSETLGSILSVLSSALSGITISDEIMEMLSYNDFDAKDLCNGDAPSVLYIITTDESSENNDLLACLLENLYQEFIEVAQANGGAFLERPMRLIFEEFGNLPRISTISNLVSASRSRNILSTFVVQSIDQLRYVYGKEVTKTLIECCGNFIFLSSPDPSMNKEVSERCGSTYYNGKKEPLITEEQLSHFQVGQCLILAGRNYPFITKLPQFSEYKIPHFDEVEIEERVRKTIKTFDFQSILDQLEKERINKLFEENEKKEKSEKTMNERSEPMVSSQTRLSAMEDDFERAIKAIEEGKFSDKELADILLEVFDNEE